MNPSTNVESEHGASTEHRQDVVKIFVNNDPVMIHRGRQSVADIKRAGNVALADVLAQDIDGKLTDLLDDSSVTIKPDLRFVSHPRGGASS